MLFSRHGTGKLYSDSMISPITQEQIVAARAFLKWTQSDLAEKSGVHINSIKKAESDASIKESTLKLILKAFETYGIEFINEGVRKKQDQFTLYEGDDGITAFYNDVATTAETIGGEFLVYCVRQEELIRNLGEYTIINSYRKRMSATDKMNMLVLKGEQDSHDHKEAYIKLRSLPEDPKYSSLFYFVYGDKFALFTPEPKIMVMNHPQFTQQFSRQFYRYWESANKLDR